MTRLWLPTACTVPIPSQEGILCLLCSRTLCSRMLQRTAIVLVSEKKNVRHHNVMSWVTVWPTFPHFSAAPPRHYTIQLSSCCHGISTTVNIENTKPAWQIVANNYGADNNEFWQRKIFSALVPVFLYWILPPCVPCSPCEKPYSFLISGTIRFL